MLIVLLPGMDGTGNLFRAFGELLRDTDVMIVPYPEDTYLTYEQLAERVKGVLPVSTPHVIVAESYSGPVAGLLAADPVGNLSAVVFVSSFISLPCGRMGPWMAKVVSTAMFRWRTPAWVIRWFLLDSAAPPDMIAEVQDAIARVHPEVLARRLRAALNADFSSMLRDCTVRIVCLVSTSDRLLGTRGLRGFVAARPGIEIVKIAGPHFLLQAVPHQIVAVLENLGLFGNQSRIDAAPKAP